jgi:hypothetical protein
MSDRLPGTALIEGKVVPGLALTDSGTGRELSLWSLRQRSAAVVLFLHHDCERCAAFEAALRGHTDEIEDADGRIVVTHDAPERFLGSAEPPVILVVDRYAAAWRSFPAPGHAFPDPADVVATLWHLATMCPECGVSTW